jgi:hypothetical protein
MRCAFKKSFLFLYACSNICETFSLGSVCQGFVEGMSIRFISVASMWFVASFTSLTYCYSLLRLKSTLLCVLLWLIGGSCTAVGTVNSKGRASSNFLYKIMVDISEAFCPQAVILLMLYSNVYFAKCRSLPINPLLFACYIR